MDRYLLSLAKSFISNIIPSGEQWDKYLDRFSYTKLNDIYFNYRYIELYINNDSSAVVEAFVFEDDDNIFFLPYIRKLIPNSDNLWDFETAYGYGGPIANTHDSLFLQSAWKQFRLTAKKLRMIVGLIRFHPLLETEQYANIEWIKILYECNTVWLDCSRTLENVMAEYPKKNIRRLKKAQNIGVTVRLFNDTQALIEFSKIYSHRMTSVGARKEYHFGHEYFNNITKLGIDNWAVYLAYTPNQEIMGGCLLLFSNHYCHYHLSGSLTKYLKYSPNDVLRHTVIQDMIKSNKSAIHFGGGLSNDLNDNLLKFKMKFSQQICHFKLGGCVFDQDAYNLICDNWETEHPERKHQFKNFLLKYRY